MMRSPQVIHPRFAAAALAVGLLVIAVAAAAPQSPTANRFGRGDAPARAAGAIRIATYNVLNLFDDVDDPALQGEHDDIRMTTTDDRCEGLARAIRAIDADVIALQEVESLEALRWFRDRHLRGAGYEHLASIDVGYYRGVECSVMSRLPIIDMRVWRDVSLDDVPREGPGWTDVPPEARRGLKFQRSPLMVTVQVNDDYQLTIFSVHHKAGQNFHFHREAEAVRIAELIRGLEASDPVRNIVVMGDFNAAPWDKSLRVYLEAGMVDTLAHRIIPRWRNPSETTVAEERLYKTHESDRVLDYILLNSAARREFVVGSAFVYGTLMPPDSYDWRTDPHPTGYASDHYPVAVDLIPRDR